MVPTGAISDEMRGDQGLIYVFNTRDDSRTVRILRGHLGPVYSMAFAPTRTDKPPLLVSTARERDTLGAVRLWDVARGESLDGLGNLPDPTTRPGLAVWLTGAGQKQVRVAIAWGDGTLRLWDAERNGGRPAEVVDGRYNSTVALLPAPPRLLTGSFREGQGRLTLRDISAGLRPADPRWQVPYPPAGDHVDIPRAVALVAERRGAAPTWPRSSWCRPGGRG